MSYHVIAPPPELNALMVQGLSVSSAVEATGLQMAEIAKPVWIAAERLGLKLDVPGFLYAWIAGTRVLVEKDEQGEIVTLALVSVGKKWTTSEDSATILELRGANLEGMLDFAKTISAAVGAKTLYHETTAETREDGASVHTVIGYPVR